MLDWEFEKAGRVVKVSPPAKLIATYLGLALRAVLDGVGFWATFEGYVGEDVKSGVLVSVLEDWCAPFPGPFLYYPSPASRRRPERLSSVLSRNGASRSSVSKKSRLSLRWKVCECGAHLKLYFAWGCFRTFIKKKKNAAIAWSTSRSSGASKSL